MLTGLSRYLESLKQLEAISSGTAKSDAAETVHLREHEQGGVPLWIWVVIALPLLAVAVAFCGGFAAGVLGPRSGSVPGQDKSAPLDVTVDSLLAEFDSNLLAADHKYKEKWLRLNGKVLSVSTWGLGEGGKPKQVGVSLLSEKFASKKWAVSGIIIPRQHGQALRLRKGDQVRVIGRCRPAEDSVTGDGQKTPTVRLVVLRECELVE